MKKTIVCSLICCFAASLGTSPWTPTPKWNSTLSRAAVPLDYRYSERIATTTGLYLPDLNQYFLIISDGHKKRGAEQECNASSNKGVNTMRTIDATFHMREYNSEAVFRVPSHLIKHLHTTLTLLPPSVQSKSRTSLPFTTSKTINTALSSGEAASPSNSIITIIGAVGKTHCNPTDTTGYQFGRSIHLSLMA